MAVGVPQLIDNAVNEANPGLVIKIHCNLLKQLDTLFLFKLDFMVDSGAIVHFLSNEENHCVDDRGGWNHFAMDSLFAGHHLEADLVYQHLVPRNQVLLKVVFQVVNLEVGLVITQDSWVLNILHWVYFQALSEGGLRLNVLRESG